MKKLTIHLMVILLTITGLMNNVLAQAPEGIIYQAEARDSKGKILSNTALDIKISIIQDSYSGDVVYEELHNVSTSNNGLFVLVIGHGTEQSESLKNIEWGSDSHFLNVQVKEPKNNDWTDMGTTQLLSVPYALHAKTAGTITETDPVFQGSEAAEITATDITNLGNLSGTNTGDQDISGIADNAGAITTLQGEQITQNTAIALNTAKVGITTAQADAITANTAKVGVTPGTLAGQMQYWNGSAWVLVAPTINEGATLQMISGVPTWVGGTTPTLDVTNPVTGKIWMDRNLGASQVAASSYDAASYGDLYQWGRGTDGHEKRTSGITTTLSTDDTPGHGTFIVAPDWPYDWRSPQNDNLWQGVSGINNPCPAGYRLPTEAELDAERLSWGSNNTTGAIASPLKLPVAGYRDFSISNVGSDGFYWSSTVAGALSRFLVFGYDYAYTGSFGRATGSSVRCLKD